MKLGSPIITTGADGSTIVYDPDTGITTTAYPDGSASTTDAYGNVQNYSSAQNLVQAAAGSSSPAETSWLTSLTQALPQLATFINSQQLAQINVQRAQKGLPALDATAYGPQVGVSMTAGSMGTIVLLAGAALLVALLMSGRRRG